MANLQKFKFLATQCAVIGSPSRSPTTSPVVHLRRRKTLRMLLGRTGSNNNHNNNRRFHRRDDSSDLEKTSKIDSSSNNQICSRHKLKDLFVSSPPPIAENANKVESEETQKLIQPDRPSGVSSSGALVVSGRIGAGGMRPLSATLRQRLLRRAWRPVLVAIPEQSP